jgi:putative FmdB family regulatory protein
MPTYEYICNECSERFENFQSMSSRPLTKRPNCERKDCNVTRVISGGSGLIFKGSGFYLTDYKNDRPKADKKVKETKKKDDKPAKKKKIETSVKTEE